MYLLHLLLPFFSLLSLTTLTFAHSPDYDHDPTYPTSFPTDTGTGTSFPKPTSCPTKTVTTTIKSTITVTATAPKGTGTGLYPTATGTVGSGTGAHHPTAGLRFVRPRKEMKRGEGFRWF